MTAAVGLALVGVMAIRMTPGQGAPRDALVTVSTSSGFQVVSSDSFGELASAATNGSRRFTDLLGRTLSSLLSSTNRSQASVSTVFVSPGRTAGDSTDVALVTPVGSEGLGVTTAAAVEGRSGTIEVVLPSGAVVSAELVGTDNGVAVVELAAANAADGRPHASVLGDDDWTVVAFGDQFEVGDDADGLRALTVPEAAPIFDASGALVGLCTIGPDGVEMLSVETLPDIAPPPATESTQFAAPVHDTEPADSSTAADDTAPTASGTGPAVSSDGPPKGDVAPSTGAPVDSSEPGTTVTKPR